MSVPEQVPYKEYRATGSNNSFEITFYLPDPKDLVVMVNKEIPLVGAYSIQDNTVVFNTPPNEGDLVELTRDTQLDRETEYKSYDNSFRPETINFDLDKIWLVLQESNLVDAKILARLKQEIEWRRTHDFNYDELAQVREKQLFDALKGYTDTLLASTNPGVFQGVIAGVVFARDGKSIQTHLEELLDGLAVHREDIDLKANQQYVDEQLGLKAPQETTYTKLEVDSALSAKAPQETTYTKLETDAKFSAYAGGRKGYVTLALAQADQANLTVNTVIDVTNDPTSSNNGSYQWNGTTLTKSAYDPLTQAKGYTDSKLLPITSVKVGRNNLDLSVGALVGSASTTIFGSPVPITGFLEKIYGSFEPTVTALKVKVFNLSGSTFTEVASLVVNIDPTKTVHLVSSLLAVSAGQYLGYYSIGGKPKGVQSGVYPEIYAVTGDVSSITTTSKYTNTDWQIYFDVSGEVNSKILEVDIKARKNEENLFSLSRIVNTISTIDKYGRKDVPVAGNLTASSTYIPFAKAVENTGEIVGAEFYLQAADSVSLFVAKRISSNTYEIIKESPYQSYPAGLNSITLKEQGVSLPVSAGDIIGWSTLGRKVGFLSGALADDLGYLAVNKNGNILTQTAVLTNTQPQINITVLAVEKPLKLVVMSQLDYDALPVKDPNTIYGVV